MISLKDDPLIKDIKRIISEEITDATTYLARGRCTSFEDYKKRIGTIEGLSRAIDLIDVSIKNYTHDEE